MASGIFNIPFPQNEPILTYAKASKERQQLKSELQQLQQRSETVPIIIDGKKIFDRPQKPIACPHKHSQKIGSTAWASEADVKNAISANVKAQKDWARLPWEERAAVFLKAADLLATKYRAKMNAATMLGQSKTCFQSEIDAVCELADFFRFNVFFADKLMREQPLHSPLGQWNRMELRPLEGFVYAIAPFNFTSISVNLAAAPVLLGGTALWKPSQTAVLSSYVGYEVLEEAGLPAGVINFVPGDAAMISSFALSNEHLAGVHFTGSTQVFQKIWSEVGRHINGYKSYPRLVGETGGKDFVFAHASCDKESLVNCLIRGAFEYQGQKCSAASRAYIPKSIWEQVRERLIEETNSIKMGDPEDFTNFMAAVIDEKAFKKIKSYIDHAKQSADAKIIAGGVCDDREGYYIRPTIIEVTNPNYPSMTEEIFGPVLSVYVYEDARFEETLALCNTASPYALTGAIFALDRQVIAHMSQTLENAAGNFYINDKPTGAVVGQQPFGGARASGTNDKAGSPLNLLRWANVRSIKENFLPLTDYRYAHMQES